MAKFTDAVVVTLKSYFEAGDTPTEAQFAELITAIQEGIEEHDHSGTGDGDGVKNLVGPVGIGVAGPLVALEVYAHLSGGAMGAGGVADNTKKMLKLDLGATLDLKLVIGASGGYIALQGYQQAETGYRHIILQPGGGYIGIGCAPDDYYASDFVVYAGNAGGVTIVSSDPGFGAYLAFADGTVGDDRVRGYIYYDHDTNRIDVATNAVVRLGISGAGSIRLDAYGAGDLQTDAAGNVTAASDARLKEQIRDTEIGLAEVLQLQGKRWHWSKESGLDTEHWYQGFVADDVEKVVPAAVGRDAQGMKTMSYNSLLPAFAAAIQEIDTRLTKLEG